MTEKKNLFQRLHAVMKEVSYVQKEDKMVNNQYRFVSHDGVTAAVRPALLNHGVLAVPQNLKRTQDGNRTEVELDVVFINIDDPEESFAVPSIGYGIDTQDKGPGKAISYAVKYALLKALSLETGDDPERDLIEHKPDEKKTHSREDKVFQRDFLYSLANTKNEQEIETLIEEQGDRFDYLPEYINGLITDAIDMKKKQFKNGVTSVPVKYGFLDVEEALEFGAKAKDYIEKEKNLDDLREWMVENDYKLQALNPILKAAKYNKDGTPYDRLKAAYNKRLPTAAE